MSKLRRSPEPDERKAGDEGGPAPGKRALTDRPPAMPAPSSGQVDAGDGDGGGFAGDAGTAHATAPAARNLPFLQLRGIAGSTSATASGAGSGAGQRPIDLQVHEPAQVSEAIDAFRRALEAGSAPRAQQAFDVMPAADRVAFGALPSINRDLQMVLRVLGPMTVPIMGECKLDFVGRTDLIEQMLQVGHPNWFDPIAQYGGTLLASFIDHLPPRGTIDDQALAKLDRLMTGTTSLALARPLFERIYTTLSDTTYDAKEVQTAPWQAEHIHRLYDTLSSHLPLAHVRTITAFYLGLDTDHAWWTADSRVVLPASEAASGGGRSHKMTGGANAQTDPGTHKGQAKGEMDKFDVGSLHEVGHGVGGRLGGHAWAESYPYVGWRTNLEIDTWSKALWGDDAALTQRAQSKAGSHGQALASVDARRYMAHDIRGTATMPAGFASSDDVEAAIDQQYGDQNLTRYWRAQQGQDAQHAYLFSGQDNYGHDDSVYVYLSRGHSHFSAYKQEAHQHKVSWYSLSSPHEWFAEQYAHYYRLQRTGAGLDPGTKAKLDELHQAKPSDNSLMNPALDANADAAAGDAAAGGAASRRVPFPW